ncbi:hypothetical protein [Rhodococcus gannanensis]|uniref:PaaI family thioesterase n=1 Tax=Rhodococcus gannanensis TaxID=1960308 RepID=A0ABW4P746_9NOCA
MTDDEGSTAAVADSRPASRFGVQPLQQTREAAATLRRLAGLLLSLEHEHPAVEAMIAQFGAWEEELASVAPADPRPRFGPNQTADQRVYLDHAYDIGSFNPSFPEYDFERFDTETASGTVNFPILYEGPPGLVHGGVLAAFFDCVIQHHNCAAGVAGKTRSLTITYRRPTPLLTTLDFGITREPTDRGVRSTARLLLGGEVLCTGELDAVARSVEELAARNAGNGRQERR